MKNKDKKSFFLVSLLSKKRVLWSKKTIFLIKFHFPSFHISAHGTYIKNGGIYASVVGFVEKTNKMITVNPIKTKYKPEGGDLVVGKVLELGNK